MEKVTADRIPAPITSYVKSILGKGVKKYSIDRQGSYQIRPSYHEMNTETWKAFFLNKECVWEAEEDTLDDLIHPEPISTSDIPSLSQEIDKGVLILNIGNFPPKAVIYINPTEKLLLPEKR